MAAAGNEKYLKGYGPNVEGFDHVPFGNLNELRNAIGPETAAILVEPVQGEGGMRAASVEYLKGLRAVCDEFGLLLMFDEIQCGMGRTGKLFAHEWAGVTPDIVATAKGIGGGFPMGACIATGKVAAAFSHGSHGTTFGGNPLAMAVGNAVLDVMLEPAFFADVAKNGEHLKKGVEQLIQRHPKVFADVSRQGIDARPQVRGAEYGNGRTPPTMRAVDGGRRRQCRAAAPTAHHHPIGNRPGPRDAREGRNGSGKCQTPIRT